MSLMVLGGFDYELLKRKLKEVFLFDSQGRLETTAEFSLSPDPGQNRVQVFGFDGSAVAPIVVTPDGRVLALPYAIDPAGNAQPLRVDDTGALLVDVQNAELLVALSADSDSVEVYGRDYVSNVVRSIAVDDHGQIIARPAQSTETAIDATVNTAPVDSNPIDCRAFRSVTFYISNTQDVDVTLEFYGSPDSVAWSIIRSFTVPAGDSTYAVLSSDYHPFLKVRAYAAASPSTGRVTISVAKYAS